MYLLALAAKQISPNLVAKISWVILLLLLLWSLMQVQSSGDFTGDIWSKNFILCLLGGTSHCLACLSLWLLILKEASVPLPGNLRAARKPEQKLYDFFQYNLSSHKMSLLMHSTVKRGWRNTLGRYGKVTLQTSVQTQMGGILAIFCNPPQGLNEIIFAKCLEQSLEHSKHYINVYWINLIHFAGEYTIFILLYEIRFFKKCHVCADTRKDFIRWDGEHFYFWGTEKLNRENGIWEWPWRKGKN